MGKRCRKNPVDPKILTETKVKDIMDTKPPMVAPGTLFKDMAKRLRKQKEDYLIVVDKKKLLGIVTENDILHAFKVPSRHALLGVLTVREVEERGAKKVDEIMVKHPLTITPDTSLREALDVMISHKFRHLPVVKDDELMGVLTVRNILDFILGES